jgi:hypothetical protein
MEGGNTTKRVHVIIWSDPRFEHGTPKKQVHLLSRNMDEDIIFEILLI